MDFEQLTITVCRLRKGKQKLVCQKILRDIGEKPLLSECKTLREKTSRGHKKLHQAQ